MGNVIFTDEVVFRCSRKSKTIYNKGNAPKPLNKKAIIKINVRRAISKYGRSKLKTFTQNIDSAYYIRILNTNLKELKKMSGGAKIKLNSDNKANHTSVDSIAFYKLKKINRLDWSLYSPDLNSIDSKWE